MNLTQSGIDTQNLSIRAQYIRLELLDLNFKTVDSIDGECIGGSLTKNANDDLRRSGNVTVAIPIDRSAITFLDSVNKYSVEVGGKIWLDKYIKVFYGIENYQNNPTTVQWFSFGICLIDQPTRNFNSQQYEISFSLIDLMAKLTGVRNGQMTGITTVIEKGKYNFGTPESPINPAVLVRTEIEETLKAVIQQLGGFEKISIYPIPQEYKYLPYDIKVGIGSTVYDLIKQLMDCIPNWQIYFDDNGILNINPIPDGKNNIVYPLNPDHIINDTMSYDFQHVKNHIVVYGRLNNLSCYTENTETDSTKVQYLTEGSNNILQLKYTALNTDTFTIDGTIFGFKSLKEYNSIPFNKVRIMNNSTVVAFSDFVEFENTQSFISIDEFIPNEIYSLRIIDATLLPNNTKIDISKPMKFEFFGKQQVADSSVNDNIDSPYYINSTIQQPNFYGGMCKSRTDVSENVKMYNIKLNNQDPITQLSNGTFITFMADMENIQNQKVNILASDGSQILSKIRIVENNFNAQGGRNQISANIIGADFTIWLLKYFNDGTNEYFIFMGRSSTVLTQVFSGGEYDNIYSDTLASERGNWELYKHSNLNNSISLDIVPNYTLDVNIKIPYYPNKSLPLGVNNYQPYFVKNQLQPNIYEQFSVVNNSRDGIENFNVVGNTPKYYLIKSITYPLGVDNTSQNISAIEIYPNTNIVGNN